MRRLRPCTSIGAAAVLAFLAAVVVAHNGVLVKPLFNVAEIYLPSGATQWVNAKVNASTRGAAGGNATMLYMMDPKRNHHGALDVIGWRIFAQDEDASTLEPFEMQMVKYAANGVDPDESPSGIIKSYMFWLFGVGGSGREARQYDITIQPSRPYTMPVANHGVAFKIESDPTWPSDGLSVQAQLNLPGDPLQPRVPAPFANQVWTFERPAGQATATPLGGRTLDTLLFTTMYVIDPVLKSYVVSGAYGSGPEDLFGPESMHPDSARGDQVGFYLQGGNDGPVAVALLLWSPWLAPTPTRFGPAAGNSPFVHLAFVPPFPVVLQTGIPNPTYGQLRFPAIPFHAFPPAAREFWCQALVVFPPLGLMRLTDAVGIKGL